MAPLSSREAFVPSPRATLWRRGCGNGVFVGLGLGFFGLGRFFRFIVLKSEGVNGVVCRRGMLPLRFFNGSCEIVME